MNKDDPAPTDEIGKTTRGLSTEVVRRQADGSWRFAIDNPHTPPSRPEQWLLPSPRPQM
jgi:ketosteroid isomerase-like protein